MPQVAVAGVGLLTGGVRVVAGAAKLLRKEASAASKVVRGSAKIERAAAKGAEHIAEDLRIAPRIHKTDGVYSAVDPTNGEVFFTRAGLEDGELTLNFRTVLNPGEPNELRSTVLRGGEQLDRVFEHFAGRIDRIKGQWEKGTNLAQFNKAILASKKPVEAARVTWTGERVLAKGFDIIEQDIKLGARNSDGTYASVEAVFRKK